MKLEIELPDALVESVVRSTMENYPEASSGNAMQCLKFRYHSEDFNEWSFLFVDEETGKKYTITKKELLAAFPLIFTKAWPRGCEQPPASADPEAWDQWLCNCDNVSHDAFVQLVCLGEVIYG